MGRSSRGSMKKYYREGMGLEWPWKTIKAATVLVGRIALNHLISWLGTNEIDTNNPESTYWFSRSPFQEMGSGTLTNCFYTSSEFHIDHKRKAIPSRLNKGNALANSKNPLQPMWKYSPHGNHCESSQRQIRFSKTNSMISTAAQLCCILASVYPLEEELILSRSGTKIFSGKPLYMWSHSCPIILHRQSTRFNKPNLKKRWLLGHWIRSEHWNSIKT